MGYRSQVRALIYGSQDNLDAFIITHQVIFNSIVFKEFKEHLTRYTVENYDKTQLHVLDLYGDDWKWYDSYPDVQAWMKFMEDSVEMNLNYEFARVGEEYSDVEYIHTSDDINLIYIGSPSIQEDMNKGETIPIIFGD